MMRWSRRRAFLVHLLFVSLGLLLVFAHDSDQDDSYQDDSYQDDSDDTSGSHVFHEQCGALGTDQDPAPGPVEVDGYRFVALSLLVRHGARNFLNDPRTDCYPTYHPPSSQTSDEKAQVPSYLREQLKSTAEPKPISMASFPLNNATAVQTLASPPALDDEHRCEGCLLSVAEPEFIALGDSVRQHYFPVLPSHPSLETSYLYSPDKSRSIVSLAFLVNGMFPETKNPNNESVMRYHTRPHRSDTWANIKACPSTVEKLLHSFSLPASQLEFEQRWYSATGQNWSWACHDALLVAKCYPERWNEVLHLPVRQDSAVVQEALDVIAERQVARFTDHKEAWKVWSSRTLVELYDFMREQATGDRPAVALWSTMDVVIAGMLTTLGVWDSVWPQFSEAVIFELYKSDKQSNRTYFRLLRRGEPVPACEFPTPEGLCDLDTWLPDDILEARNETLWKEKCRLATE